MDLSHALPFHIQTIKQQRLWVINTDESLRLKKSLPLKFTAANTTAKRHPKGSSKLFSLFSLFPDV
jgi:hypothetical protein